MNRLNLLFTLTSLSVLLVTVERFSFATQIVLNPFAYLRLHELIQMTVIILITVILPFLIFRELTDNFKLLTAKNGFILSFIFIVGVYFYATGNGVHEIGSYFWNQYCKPKISEDILCGGLYINDYYLGNILYFIGAYLMNLVLLLTEKINPYKKFSKKDIPLLIINSLIYAFAIFAYAGFDRVLVGLYFSIISLITIISFFITNKNKYLQKPVTTNLLLTYSVGSLASLLVRIF